MRVSGLRVVAINGNEIFVQIKKDILDLVLPQTYEKIDCGSYVQARVSFEYFANIVYAFSDDNFY